MNFKYSCIGDNSSKNREWLEKIGYKPFAGILFEEAEYVNTDDEGYFYTLPENPIEFYIEEGCINCIGNPQLFRAVTAMREDSDYMQWFKTDFENKLIPNVEGMYLCESREFCGITIKYKEEDFVIGSAGFHKATLEELKEHFKLK